MAASPLAWAQTQLTSATAPNLESLSLGQGSSLTTRGLASGLKLGDDAILHAAVTADIGYDSNVFYGTDQQSSAVLHLTPRLSISNAERGGAIPSGTYFDLNAAVNFVKYLSDNSDVVENDAVNPSVGGAVEFSSDQALSFALTESFSRYQQAPYSIGKPITRDSNVASATLRFAPGGGRLRVMLRYVNLLDLYENQYDKASNMGNEGVLDIGWRWLPKTTVYLQVAQGAITYLKSNSTGVSSYPLRTMVGLRGLLTGKLAINLAAGYSNAFYSHGTNPSGLGNVGIVSELHYNLSPLSKIGIGYHHHFINSPFVGQYFNMDAVYGAYQQVVASRLVSYIFGRYENRRFGGGTGRTDNFVNGGVAMDYMIGSFMLVGASYSLNLNRTNAVGEASGGLAFTKHVLLFRLGVVY